MGTWKLAKDMTEEEKRKVAERSHKSYLKNKERYKQKRMSPEAREDRNNKERARWHKNVERKESVYKARKEKRASLSKEEKEEIARKAREFRIKNKDVLNEREREIRDSFFGKLREMYKRMVIRSDRYGFVNIISREEFIEMGNNNDNFKIFYQEWVDGNKSYRLSPSVDRIDVTKGYIKDNIQFLPLSQNSSKGQKETGKTCPLKATKEGEDSLYFETIIEFSRFIECGGLTRKRIKKESFYKKYGYKVEFLDNNKKEK